MTGRPRTLRRRIAIAALILGGLAPGLVVSSGAGSSTIGTLRDQAAQLANRIDTINTKLSILSEEYDQAAERAAVLKKKIAADRSSLGHARSLVTDDSVTLHRQAVDAYVDAGSSSGISVALTSNGEELPIQQTYLQLASGTLDDAITSLQNSEHALVVQTNTLQSAEAAAQQAATALATSQANAEQLQSQLTSTLAGVSSSLQSAVAQQEAAQRAAAVQAAAQTASAAAAASPSIAPPQPISAPAVGSGAGAEAVKAAESQIGVPYVWAGSTPGVGFDCSGLTMWAWGQAGVNLPHSAEEQYLSIPHVPLDQLQPGDLVFYADGGYVYHVVMYVGNGEMIQAEDTGTRIFVSPLWGGAYGAGRP